MLRRPGASAGAHGYLHAQYTIASITPFARSDVIRSTIFAVTQITERRWTVQVDMLKRRPKCLVTLPESGESSPASGLTERCGGAREHDAEFREFSWLRIDVDASSMLLDDDVMAD